MIARTFDLIGYSGRRTARARVFGNAPCRADGGGAAPSFRRKNLDLIRGFQIELSPRLQAAIRDPKVLGKFFDEYDLTGDEFYHDRIDLANLAPFLNTAIDHYLEKKYPLIDLDAKDNEAIRPGYIWLVQDANHKIFLEFVSPEESALMVEKEAEEAAQRIFQKPEFRQRLRATWNKVDAAEKLKKN